MKRFLATGLIAFAVSTASAQETSEVPIQDAPAAMVLEAPNMPAVVTPEFSMALGLSTLGANLEAAYRINPTYGVRGALMGGIDIDYDESDEDGEFEGNATLGGVALLGDFYPLQTGWRVSAGLLFSSAELTATGITDVDGATDVEATAEATFANDIAPMITTGYELALGQGWSLNTEAGVIFTGGIDLAYTASDPTLQDELDNDPDLQDAINDAADIAVYPYVGLTVSFQF